MRELFGGLSESRAFMDLIARLPDSWKRQPLHHQLRLARWKAGLTQSQVAGLAGVHQSLVARAEAGRDVRLSTLERLYAAMGYRVLIVPAKLSTD